MDQQYIDILSLIVNETYVTQGSEGIRSRLKLFKSVISQRRMPLEGWDDITIKYILQHLAMMDSNNFPSNSGVGEREGRIYSSIVSEMHHNLAHGIGRSGDISEVQPKAAGSSIIYKLTNYMALHAQEISGVTSMKGTLVLPLATGMSIVMCLLTLKMTRPHAKYVIWPRIDQKSCLKAIVTAGLIPLVVNNIVDHDEISTDMSEVERMLELHKLEVLCVLSTTSCFAPRRPDKIDEIARVCKTYDVPQVINNAYGLQCRIICKLINRACAVGRVDFVVQSTDKNFMVPVGGTIVSSPDKALVNELSKMYPGRASSAPIVDLFVTFLSMGEMNLKRLHRERVELLRRLIDGMHQVASIYGERVLVSPYNSISIGVTLSNAVYPLLPSPHSVAHDPHMFGSMLFKRAVSGCRVIGYSNEMKRVAGVDFIGWGSHVNCYHSLYLTAACAIGSKEKDITLFLNRLDSVFRTCNSNRSVARAVSEDAQEKADVQEQSERVPIEASAVLAPGTLSNNWILIYPASKPLNR